MLERRDFRFWHFSDMPTDASNVCFLGKTGSGSDMLI
jgi:hypothetical protein